VTYQNRARPPARLVCQPSAFWGFDWVITGGLPPTYPSPDLVAF